MQLLMRVHNKLCKHGDKWQNFNGVLCIMMDEISSVDKQMVNGEDGKDPSIQ